MYRFLEREILASLTFETFNVTEQIEAHFLRCFLFLECKYENWEKESFFSRNCMGCFIFPCEVAQSLY